MVLLASESRLPLRACKMKLSFVYEYVCFTSRFQRKMRKYPLMLHSVNMNSPDSITQRAESTFRYTLATSLAYLFLHICALLLLQLPMASHPRSIVAQNYSVLTVSTNLAHSPFTHDCHEHGNGAYSTDAVHVHSHRLSPQFSPTNEAIRMEQCSLDIVSGRISRDSSGFGSSIGHFDGTGTNPSVFSSSFSPGFESPLCKFRFWYNCVLFVMCFAYFHHSDFYPLKLANSSGS